MKSFWLRPASVLALVLTLGGPAACGGSSLEGTYANADGQAKLDLKAGGQASFTVMGDTQACSFKREAAKLTLTCPAEQTFDFSIGSDGALTSPTFIGVMKKS